ncbi:MAG TPA: acyltransferase [Rhodanobacteraceae bacterium]|nr:acyltransferase [Rhodanobacteraceae bacterium]
MRKSGTVEISPLRGRIREFFLGRSLEECIESGRDNILTLRLIAALLVIYGHSCMADMSSRSYDFVHRFLPAVQVHTCGLFTFFLISGMLITLSYQRKPDLVRFMRARFLRIWPALAVFVLLAAFVLGPLVSAFSLKAYFDPANPLNPYAYALRGLGVFDVANALPGVFTDTDLLKGEVNTPLWTVSVEAMLYVCVAGLGVLGLLRRRWLTSALIAALFSWLIVWPMSRGAFNYVQELQLTVEGFFGAGVIVCLLRRHVPISNGIMLAIAIACVLASRTTHALPFTLLAIAYFVLWFAYVPRLPAMPYRADLSYGTYLWGWPVQREVLALTHVKSAVALFAIAAPIALAIGALSWVFVEKPALRLKAWPLPALFGIRGRYRATSAES